MKNNKQELQLIDITPKSAGQVQGSRKRTDKRQGWKKIVRGVFLTVSILLLAYVSLVGLILYRQNHPEKVDFDKLKAGHSNSIQSSISRANSLEKEMEALLERNEETKDFVENYTNREDYIGKEIDLSKDVEEGQVPLLMQWDKRWGYESFGDSNIGLAGCGPTCLSMAYLYFTNDLEGNPREIARYCEENGFYTSAGTSWELWTLGAEAFGLEGAVLPLDENRMKSALDAGQLIVCSMRPGDFTTTGHYILIVGYGDGGFRVNDPNRRSNSEKVWEYDVLDGQIRNLWSIGE
ncbi:MAG: C39 family peptidase [Lachnospiraceae bacterium]|nr:C39 family peptidase [Lachnospiraceae bacterium]MBQ7777119.1 C39 family peptidase [Lachnospiraceae bacterium]